MERSVQEAKSIYFRSVVDGDCVLLQPKYWQVMAKRPKPLATASTHDPEHERWLAMLLHIARQRRWSDGWAAHQFKTKFGKFPPYEMDTKPIEPSDDVSAWVNEQRAAYLKAREQEARQG